MGVLTWQCFPDWFFRHCWSPWRYQGRSGFPQWFCIYFFWKQLYRTHFEQSDLAFRLIHWFADVELLFWNVLLHSDTKKVDGGGFWCVHSSRFPDRLICEAMQYSRNQRTVELCYSGSPLRSEPFCRDTHRACGRLPIYYPASHPALECWAFFW